MAGVARRRRDERVSVHAIAALITAEELPNPLPCTVRDISKAGARLEIDREGIRSRPRRELLLPKSLMVYFCPNRNQVRCRLIWQEGNHFGVAFIGAFTVANCSS